MAVSIQEISVRDMTDVAFEETRQQVRDFIVENFLFGQADERLLDNSSLLEDGFIDSTGVMELALFMSENYGFEPSAEELLPENFDSINNLTAYILHKTKH